MEINYEFFDWKIGSDTDDVTFNNSIRMNVQP
jgi:hypothetical protein